MSSGVGGTQLGSRSIALSRLRFGVLTIAALLSGLALIVVAIGGFRGGTGVPAFWHGLLTAVGIAELGVAWFYWRLVVHNEMLVSDSHITLPWNFGRGERLIEWQNLDHAEVGTSLRSWSNQPVLRLIGPRGTRHVEIPRGHIDDWDGLLAAVSDHLGPVTKGYG